MIPSEITGESRLAAKSKAEKDHPLGETKAGPVWAKVPHVPDYELLLRIGHGAYGEVWLARSKATGALRAAKIVWRHTFEDERPFRREFEGIQRFERISREHPGQLALFHIGRDEKAGYFYYVMELADEVSAAANRKNASQESETGGPNSKKTEPKPPDIDSYTPHTLRADLEHGRLPAARVLQVSLALAEALSHLHSKGLIHRDVKPSNVIFVSGRPKLADIGLVTDASDQCSIVGTEGYLPPEGPGTAQGDIFALGKVLYEAITGMDRREFPKLPEDLRSWGDAKLVFELNEVVLRACAQDLEQRYRTCDEMSAELALLAQGNSVKQARTWKQRWAWFRKMGIVVSFLAAVAVLFAIRPRREAGRSEPSSVGPDSTNQEANALCDKAMYILRGDNFREFGAAYTNFNQAIALDPKFARPYVGLLELRVPEIVRGVSDPTVDEMRIIAEQLEWLAPRLAATYCARSVVDWGEWKFQQAERDGIESIRADPKYEFGHIWYGWMLLCFGRVEEARKQGEINLALAPSKAASYRFLGNLYYLERDYTNAITWYSRAFRFEPNHTVSHIMIARCFRAMGDYTNALEYDKKAEIIEGMSETTLKQKYQVLRRAIDEGGALGYWTQRLKWAERSTNADLYWKAVVQFHLGNTNVALDLMGESCAMHEMNGYEPSMSTVLFDDYWKDLQADSRFKALLDKIGLTKVMSPKK